jgi:hypothetical protein
MQTPLIFCHAKVCKHNFALCVDEDVARLDVSMNQPCSMDCGYCLSDPNCKVKELPQ